MKKRTSINDIAKGLNIAISTVSAVLSGKSEERRISMATKEKVLEYARQIGYQPNMVARSLRTGKSKILGMLVEDIGDPFFSSISRQVEKNAALYDYKLFYASTENNPAIAAALINAFRDRQVDGFIIAPTPGIEKEIQTLLNDQIPVVLFDRYFPGIITNTIMVDNFGGALKATQLLIDNGFKNIAFITVASQQMQMTDRQRGYETAVKNNGLPACSIQINYTLLDNVLFQEISTFLKHNAQIDAIFFATNYLAISGLRAIKMNNKRIPMDIGVIGFDDNTHFALFSPSITAVAQPIDKIGEQIVDLLLQNLREPSSAEKEKEFIVLDTHLIVRNSSLR